MLALLLMLRYSGLFFVRQSPVFTSWSFKIVSVSWYYPYQACCMFIFYSIRILITVLLIYKFTYNFKRNFIIIFWLSFESAGYYIEYNYIFYRLYFNWWKFVQVTYIWCSCFIYPHCGNDFIPCSCEDILT